MHPPLEDANTGTRVGIGLATGADSVYLTKDPDLVEPDRLLPMLMAKDTAGGGADSLGAPKRSPLAAVEAPIYQNAFVRPPSRPSI